MNRPRHHNALPAGYQLHWYEIQSVLGQGGFGITYLARDSNLGREVAIKEFLPSELAMRTSDSAVHPIHDGHRDTYGWGLNRFLSEARTLAQFQHPNIVTVFSVFEAKGTAYMVMEYEQGVSLEQALRARKLRDEADILRVLHPLLSGLAEVHGAGFIHRDIKPDNIFLRHDGVPVLLDFGSARQAVGVETRTLTTLVTPGYAPFEQYNSTRDNDRQGPWTDIYSLGATLYRVITGRGPVDALIRADHLLGNDPDPVQPLTASTHPGWSQAMFDAVDAALQFQARDRPQSIQEWLAILPPPPDAVTGAPSTSGVAGGMSGASATATPPDDDATVLRPGRPDSQAPATSASTQSPVTEPPGSRREATMVDASPQPSEGGGRRGLLTAAVLVLAAIGAAAWWFSEAWLPATPEVTVNAPAPVEQPAEERGEQATAGETETARLAEAERLAEQARIAEAERAAERARAAEAERLAEQARAAEAERLAEQARAAEAERLAEAKRIEEAARAAQAERLAEQARAAEAERLAAEAAQAAEAQRLAEEARAAQAERAAAEARAAEAQRAELAQQRELLALARADLDARRLTVPAGNNAYERLQAVLALDPDNVTASAMLAEIAGEYVRLVEAAFANDDLARAERFIARASNYFPDDPRVAEARAALAERRELAAEEAARLEAARLEAEKAAALEAQARAAEAQRQRVAEEQAAREARELAQAAERQRRESPSSTAAAPTAGIGGAPSAPANTSSAESNGVAGSESGGLSLSRLGGLVADTVQGITGVATGNSNAGNQPAPTTTAPPEAANGNRFAIFPFNSIVECFADAEPEIISQLSRAISKRGGVVHYSFDRRQWSRLPNVDEFWRNDNTLNQSAIDGAGDALGSDVIVTAFIKCSGHESTTIDAYEVRVYMLDRSSNQLVQEQRDLYYVDAAADELMNRLGR